MQIESILLESLKRFAEKKEQCHLELLQEINISELKIKQLYYLEIIHQYDHLTFTRFAEILKVTKPSVTHIVNQLMKMEFVSKEQYTRDGRIYYIELSERGEKVEHLKILELERLAGKIITALSGDEVMTLIRPIDKMAAS